RAKADPTPAHLDKAKRAAEHFLRNFPDHPAERRQLAELYMKHGPLLSARQHLQILLDPVRGTHKDDPEVLELAATCEVGYQEYGKAAEYLEHAIKTGKAPLKVYVMALEVHQRNTTDTLRESKIAAHMETLLRR